MTFPAGNPVLEKRLCGGLISDGVIRAFVHCLRQPISDQESYGLTNEGAGKCFSMCDDLYGGSIPGLSRPT